jgi:gliding motility-associated-like protein
MKGILFIIITSISIGAYSQKEANNWYFGNKAGITFQDGSPTILTNSSLNSMFGTAVISDSTGNLLFYSDGKVVYNRNHQQMPNGYGLLGLGHSQTCIIFKKPGSNSKYYIFTIGNGFTQPHIGLHYSIVDIELQGGLGDVDNFYKNIPLENSSLALEKITAVKHADNNSVWVIVRNLSQPVNEYHSYLVTPGGVNNQPARTSCLSNIPLETSGNNAGQMKVSPDSKFIVAALNTVNGGTEIGMFDNNTGYINNIFNFIEVILGLPYGVEFSSDNRFVYFTNSSPGFVNKIFQYELSLLPDVNLFINSAINLGTGGNASALQIGLDGKIYVARVFEYYLGVINNPSVKGLDCDYDSLGVYLGGPMCYRGLPQFIQTYFLRFEYEGECAGENYTFTPNFNPVPDSIHWDFGDPASGANNTSNELNPAHTYLQSGIYTATAFVRYPDGRTETATREVTVTALPEPYPLSDTVICKGTTVTLQAEGGYDSYLWSTNQNTDFITVADTGYYWVEAVNTEGCIGRDTVHVGWHPLPQLTTDTIISPTTCGNTIGAITGVNIIGGTPPYNVFWLNSTGDTIGTTNDLYNLGVDNYELWVTDDSGCNNLIASFAIQNFDSDLIITNVIPKDTWCSQPLGSLEVEVQLGLSDRLFYSIDDWTTYQTNGEFNNLLPGSYFVKVKDSLGCEAVFSGNPVIIKNQLGLTVLDVIIGHETDNDADGSISISATGDGLSYSIEGSPPQPDGLFTGLVKGEYSVTVTDIHGCDSTFTVEVDRITAQTLFATAGDTAVCNGLRASEPLLVSNFKEITSFEITLHYNNMLLDAIGYINAHPDLIAGLEPVNYPSTGMIKLRWTGTGPLTLPDNTVMLDLVMQAKSVGLSTVDWVLASNETNFINQYGVSVPVIPETGNVQVAPTPGIMGFYNDKVCEFGTLSQMAIPVGGTGTSTIYWETPHGTATGPEYSIDVARSEDSGLYRIKVVDQMNCVATDSVEVTVIPLPVNHFPAINDTIAFEQQFTLEATPGYFSYQWNTGDTTYYITGTEEGSYSVIIQTEEGCTTIDSAYLKDVYMPFYFNVPNAFTPNNDGLNDTFRPVVDYERVRMFSMVIYNRWGQLIYETTNPAEGWNGKDAPAGVYSWVISYTGAGGKVEKLMGSVVLVR